MESLAILIAAVFLVVLLLLAWHSRVQAVRQATMLEAEAVRGRELESIAMDAASLLAATLQSIETARELAPPGAPAASIADAEKAASALSSLFSTARLYLRDDDAVVRGTADGCVRVAVAVARSRGMGISVRGEETLLSFHGRPRPACDLLIDLLEASRATLGGDPFVEVELESDRVRIIGGSSGALEVPAARVAAQGWAAEAVERGGRHGICISATPAADPRYPGGVPEGALGVRHLQ